MGIVTCMCLEGTTQVRTSTRWLIWSSIVSVSLSWSRGWGAGWMWANGFDRSELAGSMGVRVGWLCVLAVDDDHGVSGLPR